MKINVTTSGLPEERRDEVKKCYEISDAGTKEGVNILFFKEKVQQVYHSILENITLDELIYLRFRTHTFALKLNDGTTFDLIVQVSKT